jgi:hypothetical protein
VGRRRTRGIHPRPCGNARVSRITPNDLIIRHRPKRGTRPKYAGPHRTVRLLWLQHNSTYDFALSTALRARRIICRDPLALVVSIQSYVRVQSSRAAARVSLHVTELPERPVVAPVDVYHTLENADRYTSDHRWTNRHGMSGVRPKDYGCQPVRRSTGIPRPAQRYLLLLESSGSRAVRDQSAEERMGPQIRESWLPWTLGWRA